MHTYKKRRPPDAKIVRRQPKERVSQVKLSERHIPEENLPIFASVSNRSFFRAPARLLSQAEHEDCEYQTGEAQQVESPAPSEILSYPSAKEKRNAAADCYARRIDGLHGRAHSRREIVAQKRERRRAKRSLTDSYHHATKKER